MPAGCSRRHARRGASRAGGGGRFDRHPGPGRIRLDRPSAHAGDRRTTAGPRQNKNRQHGCKLRHRRYPFMTSVFRLTDEDALTRHDAGLRAPAAVLEVDLGAPLQDVVVGERYVTALVLVTVRGRPVGRMVLPVSTGRLRARELAGGVLRQLPDHLMRTLVRARLDTPLTEPGISLDGLFDGRNDSGGDVPGTFVTVAVCTRDRADVLARCLDSVHALEWPDFEILVVDNAPSDDATRELVTGRFPRVRYLREPRPGLSVARNTALEQARGRIVAFTDDDAAVDPGWLRAIVGAFSRDPRVGAVTGLVQPAELLTSAQLLLETTWSFDRGYIRRWWRRWQGYRDNRFEDLETWRVGAGVNMAVCREAVRAAGGFDTTLGAGTDLAGGEECDLFHRLMRTGCTIVYEPAAIAWHWHRESEEALRRQVTGWVAGTGAYLARSLRMLRPERRRIAAYAGRRFAQELWRLCAVQMFPGQYPRSLSRAATGAWLRGFLAAAARLASAPDTMGSAIAPPRRDGPVAVREIDLAGGPPRIDDVSGYARTRVVVRLGSRMLGSIHVDNAFGAIGPAELGDRIAAGMAPSLLAESCWLDADGVRRHFIHAVERRLGVTAGPRPGGHTRHAVAVVVPTRRRTQRLRTCLHSLCSQRTRHEVEIIVVDNDPASGEVRALAAEFPRVRFLDEPRPGASRARNRGIREAAADIVVLVDDDTVAPPGWLEAMVQPFEHSGVHVVAGRVLPLELDTPAQQHFERMHGLGPRLRHRHDFGPEFFHASAWHPVPVGEVGVSANLALRRDALALAGIDGFDERLGPGTPVASGEDLYLLYCIAREGLTIACEPNAFLYHAHRRTMGGLRRQLYQHGKGHAAFQLLCLFRDVDLRALPGLLVVEPAGLLARLVGPARVPPSLLLARALGGLVGPLALVRAVLRRRPAPVAEPAAPPAAVAAMQGPTERSAVSTD